jgi:hypothetical protein
MQKVNAGFFAALSMATFFQVGLVARPALQIHDPLGGLEWRINLVCLVRGWSKCWQAVGTSVGGSSGSMRRRARPPVEDFG